MYTFPPFTIVRTVLKKVMIRPLSDSHGSAVASERMVSRPSVYAGGRAHSTSSVVEPAGSTTHLKISTGAGYSKISRLEVILLSLTKGPHRCSGGWICLPES